MIPEEVGKIHKQEEIAKALGSIFYLKLVFVWLFLEMSVASKITGNVPGLQE